MPAASWPSRNGKSSLIAPFAVVEVGVAHTARLHLHQHLARPGIGHHDLAHLDRRALAAGDHTANLCSCHARVSSRSATPLAPVGGRSRRRAAPRRARPGCRSARGCGRSGCADGSPATCARAPRAASREERDDAGSPEVVVAGDDRGPARRRELREQARHLDRGTVREPRGEVHAHEVDGRAVEVELDVQRAPLARGVGEHLARRGAWRRASTAAG